MDLSELERLERQQVGKLKLSEAVRIGAKKHPQTNYYFRRGATCFWGAAAVGYGASDEQIVPHAEKLHTAYVTRRDMDWSQLMIRSDGGEAREQIADWLEAQGY